MRGLGRAFLLWLCVINAGCAASGATSPREASDTDVAPTAPSPEAPRPPEKPKTPEVDSDNDGYPDRSDKCPKQAENRDGVSDYDGCSETIPFSGDLTLSMYVTFPERSAELDNQDEFTLSEIASLLELRPELMLAIGGHADANRERAVGKPLSLRRANAVKAWLVRKGVKRERLVVRALGSDCALKSASDASDRSRRITFNIFETEDEARNAMPGCP